LIADRALADKWGSLQIETVWRSDEPGHDVVSLLGADGALTGAGPEPEDLACVLYTSGTTGLPKGVEHTHRSSLVASVGWADALGLAPGQRIQSPFPVFSGAGLHYNAMAALSAGASCIVDEADVEGCLTRIGTYGTTVYTAVPSIFQYWLDRDDLAEFDLSSVRLLAFGGSAMAASVIERLRAAIPTAALMHTYGLTEGGPSGTYLPSEFTMTKLGSIGDRTPRRFNRFRVVDEHGEDVAPGVLGELVLAGPSVMRGYHRDPAATASVFFGEWLRSGDRVRIDEDGCLFYEGRIKDLVVRGGYNISPLEVERVLLEHPDVLDAAVYGLEHPRLGEEVAAALVAATGRTIDIAAVTAHCAAQLSDIKIPRRVQIVDELPRNAAGKVLKRVLAAQHPSDTVGGS
jgi:acyl-CoA synthetase (AMP-forming)/AMP-acid ligase II